MHPALRHFYYSSSRGGYSAVVVLDLGQSNASGRGEVNRLEGLTEYTASPTGAKVFYKSNYDSYSDDGEVQDLVAGTNNLEPTNEGSLNCFGAEVSLSTKIYSLKGKTVYNIKAAVGGSSLGTAAGVDWNPSNANELFLKAVQNYFTRCICRLIDEGVNFKVVINWLQGESDAQDATMRANYLANFTAFVTALRAKSPYLEAAPLVITKIYYATGPSEDAINTALSDYVTANPDNNYILDVAPEVTSPRKQDLPAGVKATYPPTGTDDAHNSYEFQVKRGEMIYDKLVEIGFFNGFTPVSETYTNYELNRVLERATELTYTAPDAAYLTKVDTLISQFKADGVWQKITGVHLFDNPGSGDFGKINVKHPMWDVASYVDTPTWTANSGIAFNGTSQYVNSNFAPASKVAGTYYQNMAVISFVSAIATKISFGLSASGGANDFYMHQTPGANSSLRAFNSTPIQPIPNYTTDTKFFALSRSNADNFDYAIDDTVTNVALARTGTNALTVKWGYNNLIFGNETIRVGIYSQGLTAAEILAIRSALIAYAA